MPLRLSPTTPKMRFDAGFGKGFYEPRCNVVTHGHPPMNYPGPERLS